jgi:hypothetical protein
MTSTESTFLAAAPTRALVELMVRLVSEHALSAVCLEKIFSEPASACRALPLLVFLGIILEFHLGRGHPPQHVNV